MNIPAKLNDEQIEKLIGRIISSGRRDKDAIKELKNAGIELEFRPEGVRWRRA